MLDFETKYGGIHFSNSIINKIVVKAVEKCDGKAELFNFKGKYKKMVPDLVSKINLINEESASIEVIESGQEIEIKAYIMIRFGASIKQITTDIINSVYEETENILRQKPKKVTVVVTGIISKNIARRHIEISK